MCWHSCIRMSGTCNLDSPNLPGYICSAQSMTCAMTLYRYGVPSSRLNHLCACTMCRLCLCNCQAHLKIVDNILDAVFELENILLHAKRGNIQQAAAAHPCQP